MHCRPAPDDGGRTGLVSGGVWQRGVPLILEVHQASTRLVDDRSRFAAGVSRCDEPAAGRRSGRDSDEHSLPGRDFRAINAAVRRSMRWASFARERTRSSIEQAIEILLAAKRPLIAAGDGIFWSGAAAELREFVELTKIPVYARRTGQGAVGGGPSACNPRPMEEAVHRARRRSVGDRLSVLERREVRQGTHLE